MNLRKLNMHLRTLAFAAFLATTSGVSLAQSAGPAAPPGANTQAGLAQHKQKELARIGAHMQVLQTLQNCVQAAPDHAAIKGCNEAARASMGHAAG